eukprot:TRINITY_DN6730_c0_g1_i5.p1 TRINITY_DN6730_c0_g1~~TRINITY_DN6730_c0_g1_i5.p1  ORF type:complete len:143 (-),score=17.16 TRINITY_DN6730_c0_g1_i5:51-479(-)
MKQEHEATTKPTIERIRRTQAELCNALLKVMTKLESKRALGLPLHTQEIDFRRQLESIKRKLAKPAQFQARVTELQSLSHMHDRSTSESMAYKVSSETQSKLFEALDFQRRGLQHLTDKVTKDIQDITTIQEQLEKSSITQL